MVEPQKQFFGALADRFPGWVLFVETASLDRSLAEIGSAERPKATPDSLEALNFIADWIGSHSPGT